MSEYAEWCNAQVLSQVLGGRGGGLLGEAACWGRAAC